VAITPASGFRAAHVGALFIGLAAGFFCSFMVFQVKSRFGYDDSLDAFGVHGAGGTLGAILTGVFAASVINPIYGKGRAHGRHRRALEPDPQSTRRRWHRLGNLHRGHPDSALRRGQDSWASACSRAGAAGLDLSQHGEEGYDFNSC
jgi:ammonium transporter, Amt family